MKEVITENGLYSLDIDSRFHPTNQSYYIEKDHGYCVFHIVPNSEEIDFSVLDKNENTITHIPWINTVVKSENWEDFVSRNATSH